MLIDHRHYRVRPLTLYKQLALFREHGYPILQKYFGVPLRLFIPLDGDTKSYIHIWVFQSFEDRVRRRELLNEDPAWQAFLERSQQAGFLTHQESRLMTPASFIDVPWPRLAPMPGSESTR